jgi:zinc protease
MQKLATWRLPLVLGILAATSVLATPPNGVVIRDVSFKMGNLELPSGMRIVIEEDRSQPLVAVVAVVDVGSAQDPAGKEGLAHLVEHLTFRAKPDGKLARSSLLDFAGAGSWNAFTDHDLTTYVVVGPSEALPQLLALEGKRLLSPLAGLDAQTFEVEKGVVKNELSERDEQGQSTAIHSKLYGALYPEGHPYHRPIAGSEASLAGLTLPDAQAFVQKHYLPRNITLYVSGDVDLTTIQKVFDATLPREFLDAPASGAVAPPKRLGEEAMAVPKPPAQTQLETVRAPSESPMLYIGWSLPGGLAGQKYLERFARTVFERVSYRAATSSSDIEALSAVLDEGRYGNTLVCAVQLKTGRNPEKSLTKVLDQVVQMWAPVDTSSDGVFESAVDFHWLQNTAVVGVALQTESVGSRAIDKATLIHWTGDPQAWGKDLRAIYDLNPAKMQSFAYEWLGRDRARAVFVQPSGGGAPQGGSGPPGVFAAADNVRVKIAPEALKTFVHGPTRDIHAFSMSNGMDVFLVRRASAPTVAVTLGFRGGYATAEPLGAAELVTALAGPTQTRNGPPSKFGGRVYMSANEDTTYYTGRAASGNLENVLALLSDSVRTLHVDGSMKVFWDDLVNGQRRADALGTSKAEKAFLEQTYKGTALGRMAQATDFDHLGTGDLQTWIDRSIRPKNAALAVVGDIDVAEAEKLVRSWFEGWEGAQDPRGEAHPPSAASIDGPVQVIHVDRPGAKQTEIRLGCSMPTSNQTDTIALRLLGARITGRLSNLARTSLGGSYGFQGGATVHRQVSGLDVSGNVDAHALTRVLAVARRELDGLGSVNVTEDELGLLKWHQGLASNLRYATNSDLARGLVSLRLSTLPVDAIQKYPELLAAVTPEDLARVGAACRKTAVLLLSGDPDVVTKALQATAH